MPAYEINGIRPVIGEGTWIAPTAAVIGNVHVGRGCYIGFGAVVRGDFGPIRIGDEAVVEDNVVIHTARETMIGNKVIIGHMAMVHDAMIHDCALVGMQSMICDGVEIGSWTIIAEQSLVLKHQKIPPEVIYGGAPAKKLKDMTDFYKEFLIYGQKAYADLAQQYRQTLKQVEDY